MLQNKINLHGQEILRMASQRENEKEREREKTLKDILQEYSGYMYICIYIYVYKKS